MPTSFDVLLKNWLSKISHSVKEVSISGDTMTVTKTNNSTEDLTLGLQALEKKIFAQSTWYKRPYCPYCPVGTKRSITIPAGTQVAINGNLYVSTTDVTKTLTTTSSIVETRKGKDVYIYACVPESGTEPVFETSLNSTVPSGYAAENSRKIGGFHCLCADVGTIADHPLSGYVAGDILPNSVWDLLHRAVSENEGMVYVNGAWYDIYMPNSGAITSLYNVNIKMGTYYTGEQAAEFAGTRSKRLLSRDEFMVVAKGSNEKTNIKDSARPATSGGHVDSADRRMISNFGLEDCCGAYWFYTSDVYGAANRPTTANYWSIGTSDTPQTLADGDTPASEGSQFVRGYGVQDDGRGTTNVLNENSLNVYGLARGALVRMNVGGSWSMGDVCGSRGVQTYYLSSARTYAGPRFASNSRIVNL